MGKEFNLNIGKEGGGGSTGFSLKQSLNMIKAKALASQKVGTDVMSDGYYNQVNKVEGIEDGGSGINMNVPGPQYGSPTLQTDADDDDIEREFVYGDDSGNKSPGVTGTVETKDRETNVNEPDIIGRTDADGSYYEGVPRKGDKITQSNIYRDGEKAKLEITDTKRTKTGKEKPGKMGKSTVKIKKGDIEFS